MIDLKDEATSIFLSTLSAIDLESELRKKLQVKNDILYINETTLNLSKYSEILLIGFGKASLEMGKVLEDLLDEKLTQGVLVTNQIGFMELKSEVIHAGHPSPNVNSIVAGRKILDLIEKSTSDALIIFLISGGGSALVEVPKGEITLKELQEFNRILINCGASISEVNTLRKAISRLKGGKLRELLRNKTSIAIYLSDVNKGDIGSIASGPLWRSERDEEAIDKILRRYNLLGILPQSINQVLTAEPIHTSKKDSCPGSTVHHILLLESYQAMTTASALAQAKGYQVEIIEDQVEGDYREMADSLIERIIQMLNAYPSKYVCLISGGEASCRVQGQGIGGRNQEFVLYSAIKLEELAHEAEVAILSCGTDGIDGISPATGAVVDSRTIPIAKENGLEIGTFLKRNDSHSFLKNVGGVLLTGPSGNNIRDLRILLAKSKSR